MNPSQEKWEQDFDRQFIDENYWQGEDDFTKNVAVGNIKHFIRTALQEAFTQGELHARSEPHLTADGYCCACDYDKAVFHDKLEAARKLDSWYELLQRM